MYKAVRNYLDANTAGRTLSFAVGDELCILEKTNDNWWLASNASGKIGYVPKTCLIRNEKVDSHDVVLESIERGIAAVYASSAEGSLSSEQQVLLKKLNQHKQEVLSSSGKSKSPAKRPAPPPSVPTRASDRSSSAPPPPQRSLTSHKRQAPQPSESVTSNAQQHPVVASSVNVEPTSTSSDSINNTENENRESFHPKVPVQLGQELINKLQSECTLSDAKARAVIESLLHVIGDNIPPLYHVVDEIIDTLPSTESSEDPGIETLRLALANMLEIKNDAQQSNWAIKDDREEISEILTNIMEALSSSDKAACMSVLTQEDYEYVITLATYHQMESRVALRLLVLQVLGVICSLSNKLVSVLMTTVLPNELVRDIVDHTDDIQRTCYSALVLSMIFSTGEPIPLSYYDTIGGKFISFLLNCIEEGVEGDDEDKVGDIFVRLILAINLHFLVPEENLVMKTINERGSCTTLSEKTMLLINRGDDPVKISEDENPKRPHSVLKFFQDVFSREDTALSFLYTNDLLVLADIITRNVADLNPGSKSRTDYLDLLLNLLARSSYKESKHRSAEILSILQRINDEEAPLDAESQDSVEFDKTIVDAILTNHMSCFT